METFLGMSVRGLRFGATASGAEALRSAVGRGRATEHPRHAAGRHGGFAKRACHDKPLVFATDYVYKGSLLRHFLMVSQTSEYALRAVIHLARLGGGPAVTQDVAAATRIPAGYLHKILRMLARDGILRGQRGIGGGFALARTPERITVLDVLAASDGGLERITRCPIGEPGHEPLCALHRLLNSANDAVEDIFRRTTIRDLLRSGRGAGALCTVRSKSRGRSPVRAARS